MPRDRHDDAALRAVRGLHPRVPVAVPVCDSVGLPGDPKERTIQHLITINGIEPIIMHNGAAGLDTRSPQNLAKAEITRKKGSNRTEADDALLRALETETSFWLDEGGAPTIPATAVRSCIERAARKLKQGPQVREGLIVDEIVSFDYDRERYGVTIEELRTNAQFTTGVVVQRSRVLRTRAKFDLPWSLTFRLDCDDELVDAEQLGTWLDIAGRRIGLGDWRPEKSGTYGRFELVSIESVE